MTADHFPWKAVRGMRRTFERRPYRDRVKRNAGWSLLRPTLDRLWIMSGPDYWARELEIRRAVRAAQHKGVL